MDCNKILFNSRSPSVTRGALHCSCASSHCIVLTAVPQPQAVPQTPAQAPVREKQRTAAHSDKDQKRYK